MPELKGQLWRPRPIDLGWADWGTLYGSLSLAALMLAAEPEGLAIDFSDASISIKDLTTPANAIESQGTVSAGALVGPGAKITYSAPSPKLCKKSDGTYGYRAQNLYLNSESPANQSVAVVSGLPYIIAVTGTVSITLSGAATGTVTAGNPITFTASTGTLTCGSTSGAGTVHLRSTLAASEYIRTTTVPLYDLPYDWTGTYYYPLVEPAAMNLGQYSRTWPAHANYSGTNITKTQVTGFDGEANSAYAFEATVANARFNCHSLDNLSDNTAYTRSYFIKRLAGSGPIYVAPNGAYGWMGDGTETVTGSNLVTNGDFATNVSGWTVAGTTDGSNYFTWNAGGYADFAASSGSFTVSQNLSGMTPGKVYRFSVAVTIASGTLRFSAGSNGMKISTSGTYHILVMATSATYPPVHFSCASGTLVSTIDNVVVKEVTSINLDVSSQLVANEWVRVSMPFVSHAGSRSREILIATSGDKIAVDQHQIETGTVATSPIITAGATVTRAADNLSIAMSAFPFNASAGTLYVKWRLNYLNTSSAQVAACLGASASANEIRVQANNTAGSFDAYVTTGGVTQGFNSAAGVTANAIHRQAFAYAANDTAHSVNGGAPITDATVTLPTGIDRLVLGSQRTASASFLGGHILALMYVPRRMTNAELPLIGA